MDRGHKVISSNFGAARTTTAIPRGPTRGSDGAPVVIGLPARSRHRDELKSGLHTSAAKRWRAVIAALMRLVVVAAALAALDTRCPAQIPEPRVQGPWAYTQRFDEFLHGTEFMAGTPAANDEDTWFLLACRANQRLSVALMHIGPFPYSLISPITITLRSDAILQMQRLSHKFVLRLFCNRELDSTLRHANGRAAPAQLRRKEPAYSGLMLVSLLILA